MRVNLSGVSLKGNERRYVLDVLESGILSMGKYTADFESAVAAYAGRKYGVSVSSGTAGLFLLLLAGNIGKGHDIITSPFSFIASANVIEHTGARPVFADIENETQCISAESAEEIIRAKYRKTAKGLLCRKSGNILKGILAVDIFGAMPDYTAFRKLASKYNLMIFEDACEALGSSYKGQKAGSLGKGSVFAFYPNKQVTTGEGGIILTNSRKDAEFMRAMRNQGRKSMDLWLTHHYLGYNFRINEIACAIGLAQMERIEEILAKRVKAADRYSRLLSEIDGVSVPSGNPNGDTGWFVYVIRTEKRNALMKMLIRNEIGTRPYFTPIHLQPFYKKKYGYKKGDYPVAESIAAKSAAIPFHTEITVKEQVYVTEIIKGFLE